MPALDYRQQTLPPYVVADYAFRRKLTLDEAELRLRAVAQMVEGVMGIEERTGMPSPRWADDGGRVIIGKIDQEISRLCGEQVGLLLPGRDDTRVHASFLALMFYDGDPDGDVRRLPGAWWRTPLGQLCDRVLNVAG